MKYKKTLLAIFFAAAALTLPAQETCLVHFNKAFYVSGEVVWYKLYLPSSFPAGNQVVVASVADQDGQLIHRSHLRIQGEKTAYGFYKIPYECQSAVYRLILQAARKEANVPVLLADVPIAIYNDLETVAVGMPSSEDLPAELPLLDGLRVSIRTDRENYAPRDQARITIAVRDRNGQPVPAQLSVSINDEMPELNAGALFINLKEGKTVDSTLMLEENIPLRGKLLSDDGKSILTSGNVGAYLKDKQTFLYDKGNRQGEFELDLPDLYGAGPVHFVGLLPEKLTVQLDETLPPPSAKYRLSYPPQVVQYLELSRQRKIIYQLYGELETNLAGRYPEINERPVKPDLGFWLDEYEPFADIPTFCKEVFVPIRFRNRKETGMEVRLMDPTLADKSFFSFPPLFIIDGRVSRDENYFSTLDIAKVERIDFYYIIKTTEKYFGPLGRRGVIMIQSKTRDMEIPVPDQKNLFQLPGFQLEVDYPIEIRDTASSRVLLRPSLYWSPIITTNTQGEATLTVNQPDDHSRFRIEVVAQGIDGQIGRGVHSYSVGKNR